MRRVGVFVDVDGVLAEDRMEVPRRNVDLLERAGRQAQGGDLGGVALCTMRDFREMGEGLPRNVDFLGVSGAIRRDAGDRLILVDPRWVKARALFSRVEDELISSRDLLKMLASNSHQQREAAYLPEARGRGVIIPVDGADPQHHEEITAYAAAVAERFGLTAEAPRSGLIRMSYPPLEPRMDKGAALSEWAERRRLSAAIVLDDVDAGVARVARELQNAEGRPVAVMKIAVDSPGARIFPEMFEAPDLAASLSGREAVTRFIERVVDLAESQAAERRAGS